jgi:hypothetical protein
VIAVVAHILGVVLLVGVRALEDLSSLSLAGHPHSVGRLLLARVERVSSLKVLGVEITTVVLKDFLQQAVR